jgi:ATP-binding cassette subfamily F protein 3
MSILTTYEVGQSYGSFDVFKNISVGIPNDGKVGLVGPNGIGKTTLLLILAGLAKASAGAVHWARGTRLGYLPQEAARAFAGHENTVYDEMLTVFAELRQEEARLRRMEDEMAAAPISDELLESYGTALEKFELAGGYEYETRIHQVLEGLGFSEPDHQLPLSYLSGGQKTRALLARLLLEKPDLLILDEPTNHLDIQAVEWLENTLKVWDGAILIVSHDRYFLNRVVNTIWEMSRTNIEVYRGNYNAYLQQREERWSLRQQEFEANKERLEKELDFIRRNIAGQRTQMAKGKLSRISREVDVMQRAGMEAMRGKSWAEISGEFGSGSQSMSVSEVAQAIKELERPQANQNTMNLRFKASHRSGNVVLRTSELRVGFPETPLFAADDIELWRQDCAALIGPNGTGKTTFLKTITNRLEPLAGTVTLGASLKVGYFAQAHEQLNQESTVIDELTRHHPMLISEARNYLARYLFQEDDVFKPVSALSGGERGRLALAILALEGANFLLLDEPTNHLDIPAQEVLQEVLEHYEGTILLVSHDRYLVDRLATQIWSLEDGRLRVFKGPYQEYLADREQTAERAKAAAEAARTAAKAKVQPASNGKVDKARQQQVSQLEQEIHRLETQLEQLSQALQRATEKQAFDKIQKLGIEYNSTEKQLEERLAEWEKVARE